MPHDNTADRTGPARGGGAQPVRREQRFTRNHPCPICGGSDGDARGAGKRCHGFLSPDGRYAHCARDEYAGPLELHRGSETYAHLLDGDCHCGIRHGSGGAPVVPAPRRTTGTGASAGHGYHDADGVLRYEVIRREPKDFRQRRPDGTGGWIWKMDGVDRILYRLPGLLKTDADTPVFVVEGEKDADRLAGAGLVATTNVGGAGKWRDEYSETLRNRHVVILPDNDEVGLDHAEQVARSLAGLAASVKIVELPDLPEKGDVSDWLDAAGTIGELRDLAAATPRWSPSHAGTVPLAGTIAPTERGALAWPAPPDAAAFYGLAGDIVRALAPHTEADPVALLVLLLAAIGNIVGSGRYWKVSGKRQPLLLFPVLVGDTSKGRKGTAWGTLKALLALAAPEWLERRTASGLSSGEGLIWAVRDPIEKQEPIKEKGAVTSYQKVVIDAGVEDKRLFVTEEEFAGLLSVMGRQGNTLSAIIRQAWDGGTLRTLTKNSPATATGAHVAVTGHVTKTELLRYLHDTEAANGFANRFLWVAVRRSQLLPNGGQLDESVLAPLAERLRWVIEEARRISLIDRSPATEAIWACVYGPLGEGGVGMVGDILGRAEPQVMRLAAIYAVLDRAHQIRPEHLQAALAVWDYAADSARYIFGDALGDPVADTILAALRTEGALTRTEISGHLGRNIAAARLDAALAILQGAGLARQTTRETGGRSAVVWQAA